MSVSTAIDTWLVCAITGAITWCGGICLYLRLDTWPVCAITWWSGICLYLRLDTWPVCVITWWSGICLYLRLDTWLVCAITWCGAIRLSVQYGRNAFIIMILSFSLNHMYFRPDYILSVISAWVIMIGATRGYGICICVTALRDRVGYGCIYGYMNSITDSLSIWYAICNTGFIL